MARVIIDTVRNRTQVGFVDLEKIKNGSRWGDKLKASDEALAKQNAKGDE